MILLKNTNKFLLGIVGLLIFTSSCDKEDSLSVKTIDVEKKAKIENVELNKNYKSKVAEGPSYMGSDMTIEWKYVGLEAESVDWWYRKVGGQASYLIGSGSTMTFSALADTFYSNDSHETSDFIIYLKVCHKDGSAYISMDYNIQKKGAFKLIAES